uniref:Uncharacterized protein n=1 Tax=Oryzias latipes TaxID=8090 RepID=A0A3P9LSI4_ORYLA
MSINHNEPTEQTCPEISEQQVNTDQTELRSCGINHVEGGWPKEIDLQNLEHTSRFRKRKEREDSYINSITQLGSITEHSFRQNNSVEIYEKYFEDEEDMNESHEPPLTKTMTVFSDPTHLQRAARGLSWSTSEPMKVAAAFASNKFPLLSEMCKDSYVWDIEKSSSPLMVLKPSSSLLCLEYNPNDPACLVGGCYDGRIVYWDTRESCWPVGSSPEDHSHKDPVSKVSWLQLKGKKEAISTSTDGQVLWWDIRKMSEPTERLILDLGGERTCPVGAISLGLNHIMNTKIMLGTQHGLVISCDKNGKTPAEKIVSIYKSSKGPVYAVQKNPFFPGNFLTAGDKHACLWSDIITRSPIMAFRNGMQNLTGACWSPFRPSVFFTLNMDGVLDIWDILFKQTSSALSVKVCNSVLCSISVPDKGPLMTCGSTNGEVILLKVWPGLLTPRNNEISLVTALIENGEKQQGPVSQIEKPSEEEDEEEDPNELIAQAERDFYSMA